MNKSAKVVLADIPDLSLAHVRCVQRPGFENINRHRSTLSSSLNIALAELPLECSDPVDVPASEPHEVER